eukprot:Ihof_evm4s203 gene=Ihof_evmTU4s203
MPRNKTTLPFKEIKKELPDGDHDNNNNNSNSISNPTRTSHYDLSSGPPPLKRIKPNRAHKKDLITGTERPLVDVHIKKEKTLSSDKLKDSDMSASPYFIGQHRLAMETIPNLVNTNIEAGIDNRKSDYYWKKLLENKEKEIEKRMMTERMAQCKEMIEKTGRDVVRREKEKEKEKERKRAKMQERTKERQGKREKERERKKEKEREREKEREQERERKRNKEAELEREREIERIIREVTGDHSEVETGSVDKLDQSWKLLAQSSLIRSAISEESASGNTPSLWGDSGPLVKRRRSMLETTSQSEESRKVGPGIMRPTPLPREGSKSINRSSNRTIPSESSSFTPVKFKPINDTTSSLSQSSANVIKPQKENLKRRLGYEKDDGKEEQRNRNKGKESRINKNETGNRNNNNIISNNNSHNAINNNNNAENTHNKGMHTEIDDYYPMRDRVDADGSPEKEDSGWMDNECDIRNSRPTPEDRKTALGNMCLQKHIILYSQKMQGFTDCEAPIKFMKSEHTDPTNTKAMAIRLYQTTMSALKEGTGVAILAAYEDGDTLHVQFDINQSFLFEARRQFINTLSQRNGPCELYRAYITNRFNSNKRNKQSFKAFQYKNMEVNLFAMHKLGLSTFESGVDIDHLRSIDLIGSKEEPTEAEHKRLEKCIEKAVMTLAYAGLDYPSQSDIKNKKDVQTDLFS